MPINSKCVPFCKHTCKIPASSSYLDKSGQLRKSTLVFLASRDSESPQDLTKDSLDKESSCGGNDDLETKSEDTFGGSNTPPNPAPSSVAPPPLIPFSPGVPPPSSIVGNPLQQMVTITNSLTALPPNASPNSPGGMPFRNNAALGGRPANKVPLPPISQQQFDKYSHINTELLVRKVRPESSFLALVRVAPLDLTNK